jgi:hypothetical protein
MFSTPAIFTVDAKADEIATPVSGFMRAQRR